LIIIIAELTISSNSKLVKPRVTIGVRYNAAFATNDKGREGISRAVKPTAAVYIVAEYN